MTGYRLLPLTMGDAFTNMATDEAISIEVGRGNSRPTLRFYRWNPSAISLGRFQGLEYEVDTDATSRKEVDIVRRISGGGSVFHDIEGELTYSFTNTLEYFTGGILDSFRRICEGVVEGLKVLGLEAEFEEVNDVMVNGRKISGSAQARSGGSLLQHGTILINPDIRLMFELLKVSPEKISDKFVTSVKKRVTSLAKELGSKPSFEEVRSSMVKGFSKKFNVDFYEEGLTEGEKKLVRDLLTKYASKDWTEKR